MEKYDYLIIGAGLFGSVFAYEANKRGFKCLVIDKRNHFGGNIFCENYDGINVHKYGAHIFHTNDKDIWEYVNQFAEFNRYINSPIAIYNGDVYNLPFNMNTFSKLWKITTPNQAYDIIKKQVLESGILNPKNLEEQAISMVGKDIYEILIKEYTKKQWGRDPKELPSFIIKRLPVRFNYDNNYFNDKFQGIPIGGYNKIVEKLLNGIEIRLNTDFFKAKDLFKSIAKKIVFTGKIDEYFDYEFGHLEYRSLRFETKRLEMQNFQGNAVVNYTDNTVDYTRIIEHKHFEFGDQKHTMITYEYPEVWKPGNESYYPINDEINNRIYSKYYEKTKLNGNIIFGGRLAEYKYYDMHQIIASALKKVKDEFNFKL
jgi:UDP-galactopyranose mutase